MNRHPNFAQIAIMAKSISTKKELKTKGTKGLSAHDLVNKQVYNEGFRISDEDMKNVDTSISLTNEETATAEKIAAGIEKEPQHTPYDILGE